MPGSPWSPCAMSRNQDASQRAPAPPRHARAAGPHPASAGRSSPSPERNSPPEQDIGPTIVHRGHVRITVTPEPVGETSEGLEATFALYYLSRYLLSHQLTPALSRSATPVIINVAGVGITKGSIHWQDLQLARDYGMVTAQLQAARANDLLGVSYAAEHGATVHYVLYHPGFTRSGDLSVLPAAARAAIRAAARVSARPVEESVLPIHDFIDNPPPVPLTAIDRDKPVPLTLATLDPAEAARLAHVTAALLCGMGRPAQTG
jgi:hypothetical protein